MTPHVHALDGCRTRPLASYLKALAVLRLVSEQKDADARGYWKHDVFHLITALNPVELARFFLDEWEPMAFPSPWNKGSGFFQQDDKGIAPLESSTAPRFREIREGIGNARMLTRQMDRAVQDEKAIKAESNQLKEKAAKEALRKDPVYKQRLARATKECKRLKDALQPECRKRWRGSALRWLRAAVIIETDGQARFPSLLGTGGNDGKLDFTNNACQRLADLFDLESDRGSARPCALPLLRAALWNEPVPGRIPGGIGQFDPAGSGGPNATTGPLGRSLLNPWDLVLLLEGAILFVAGTTRRLDSRRRNSLAAAPFCVRGTASGYASASPADEGVRGEQWFPVWDRPWSLGEVTTVLKEGRCQIGARASENAVEAARAVARLGVARGIEAFERYGFLERNGKSNYAVPLGRWQVCAQARAALLDDLEASEWWARVRRAARSDRAPGSFVHAERLLSDAVLAALAHGSEPARWSYVLVALAKLEAQMVTSGAFVAKQHLAPIPRLSVHWLTAIQDGCPETRLAACLGGAFVPATSGRASESVRIHWLPIDERSGRFRTTDNGLARDPRVVVTGRDPWSDLISIVERRLLDSFRTGVRLLPLRARHGWAAVPSDIAALLAGTVDVDRTIQLARALTAVEWSACPQPVSPASNSVWDLDPAYLVLRLCHMWGPLGRTSIPVDPGPVRLLAAGDAPRAFRIALRRLAGSGIRAPIREAALPAMLARRYAASLAFPIDLRTATGFARSLDPCFDAEGAMHAH